MPRVIYTCRYLKPPGHTHKANHLKYIATRDDCELLPKASGMWEATQKQERLIAEILDEIPGAKAMHEYSDYLAIPNRANASEFISRAIEENIDLFEGRRNYVDYISSRPRTERTGIHGLFTDLGVPVVLERVADEVAGHPGNVWTNVLSLKREDAARLGFDNAESWMALIRGKRQLLAEHMKIPEKDLRWYASFHNESHHPHVHLIAYSADPKKGYLTEKGIESLRSAFAREIFKDDLLHIYKEQTEKRGEIYEQAAQALRNRIAGIAPGTNVNDKLESDLLLLADRLGNTGGKKVYGYLKVDVKTIIDRIIDGLAKTETVASCYAAWHGLKCETLRSYTDKMPDLLPLSQQKELGKIRQLVIDEALRIGDMEITSEPDDLMPDDDAESEKDYNAAWTGQYKEARKLLFGTHKTEPDFEKAFELLNAEAENGNALAMCDLGWMYKNGLGREADMDLSYGWHEKALSAFMAMEGKKAEPYTEYRIGKLHFAGLGTDVDYEEAAKWFTMASRRHHKYAQYSLAGMYLKGQGVEQDDRRAFDLYVSSEQKGNAYAAYEAAKMLRDGIGTKVDTDRAARYFESAFAGFINMERKGSDDKLMYRIGQMLLTGTGTEKDAEEAAGYFEKAVKLNNNHAQYMLGKMYLTGNGVPKDREEAVRLFTLSAEQGNINAQFFLDNMDRHDPFVLQSILRMFHHLGRVFKDSAKKMKHRGQTDSKARRKEREKKTALGHAVDDYAHEQII